ncbi:hypothetical protein GBP59_03730 [Mycobacterium avium subsp. hominissuis]|uniref:hypothetical protein n=1 Tax=Mycobacterium avium TaxID=1764 RepID=UPI001CC57186|nr:hypothetical protein [Mycobacterium avium]MBZ4538559.1 hypothetical protein [Mycobacterium avium subsp. hominissuis]
MERSIVAHRDGYRTYSGCQIDGEVVSKLLELVRNLERETNAKLSRLFANRDLYDDEPTTGEVTAAATLITDFWRAILLLAREVRGVEAPKDYSEVLDNLASLVGSYVDGLDTFITRLSRVSHRAADARAAPRGAPASRITSCYIASSSKSNICDNRGGGGCGP